MPLHIIKLCVGVETIQELADWQVDHLRQMKTAGKLERIVHTTRMTPSRAAEVLDGGSLYWVIKGKVCVRQRIVGIEQFKDGEGIGRCHLVLDPKLARVSPRPKRPFQGWRYLQAKDAPKDLAGATLDAPEELRKALADLGLL